VKKLTLTAYCVYVVRQ